MSPLFEQLDLRDADVVIATLEAGAAANRLAPCRRGSIDVVEMRAGTRLVLTGDLHDNPLHMARVVRAARLADDADDRETAHLTLHELIHGDRLSNGMDFSYRVLARAAMLKSEHPEHVHVLLANHELAQAMRTTIVKEGVRVVEAFDEALEFAFGDRATDVRGAVERFVLSMPLALRVKRGERGDILCAHSLPGPEMMDLFDPTVIERDLRAEDLAPRRGSAHLMVWGRGHEPAQLSVLAARWGIGLFVLGHEHASAGVMAVMPNAVVLNSDHERGVFLDLGESDARSLAEAMACVKPLSASVDPA